MAKLVAYSVAYPMNNSITSSLAKAKCEFCGRLYGSINEAKKCEEKHIMDVLAPSLQIGLEEGKT